tara:strand:- start:524 stop:874 length:351 start_codon:yes stop_codon:yes gene_type:complete
MKLKLIVIFLIGFITISSQNMLSREIALDELQKVFPEVELNLNKPYNKFVTRKQVNNRALVFITGAALTTISTVQIIRARNSHFRFDHVKGAVPIGPHGILFGVGLFTMSFSFVIS